MERNKSELVREEDIKVVVSHTCKNNIRTEKVVIYHITTGFKATETSTKGQIEAYNLALERIENKIYDILASTF